MVRWNRSALVVRPGQPFLDWLHTADPTSHDLTLPDLAFEPRIYLIRECGTPEDVADVLHELCEEIFTDQLAGWYTDTASWPEDCSYDVFCRWFDYQHHSMLIDLCQKQLRAEAY